MADRLPDEKRAQHMRLLEELDRVEREQRELDLHDPLAVEACRRRLEALRRQIATLEKNDQE